MLAARDGQRRSPESPAVQVFALGSFRVVIAGRAVADQDWRRKPARQLFKCLLSRPNRRMTRDEVIELLWPASDPAAAASNLRSTLHAMRRTLEASKPAAPLGMVFGDRDSIWLRPDVELWVDADAFEQTIQQARTSPDPLPLLEQASVLYAGMYLPDDVYEDWATERRDRLKQTWVELQFRLSEEFERRGDPDAAARPLQQLLQADPCDERAAQEAMQLLNRHGRRAEALRIYQRLVQALKEELDLEPSETTVELHRQITVGQSAVGPDPSAAAFRCAYPFPFPTELIGRGAELEVLSRVLARGRTIGQAALLAAPAGTGKSALLGQVVRQAQAQGVLCLAGGCYEEQGAIPLGPFHDALVDYLLSQPVERLRTDLGNSVTDLARVVPELRYVLDLDGEPTRESPKVDRMRVFGAIHAYLRRLAEKGPTLVCLEDLHAADEATLELFHYLVRQTRRLPLVLIGTYRSDEAPPDQPLAQMLGQVTRERLAERVRLSPLDRDETTRLTTSLLEGSASEPLADALFTTTGGNPLFVEQLVMALSEGGLLQRRAGLWYGTGEIEGAPHIVREVIAQRVARLPASCRETLAMASVLGQTFEHGVLLAAREPIDERVLLDDLDRAITASVLQDMPGGYAFRHVLLRDAVYASLSGPRRMLLHSRAGELLEQAYGARADGHAAELARHFTLAGQTSSTRRKALHYSIQAGQRAAELSSYPESHAHFSRAWDIIEHHADLASPSLRLAALEGRGWAELELARWSETAESYRQALQLATNPVERARAHGLIAFAMSYTPNFKAVLDECEAGLTELVGVSGPEAAGARLHLQHMIALDKYLQGRYREVIELGRRMQTEGGPTSELRRRMLAHTVIGWGEMGLGQVEQALVNYRLVLAAAEQGGEKLQVATSHENLGIQNYLGGRFADARFHLGRALAIFHESANELRAANSLHTICRVWVAEGEHVRASEQILQAIELGRAGQERRVADAHHVLGTIHTLRCDWNAAATSFEQALRIRTQAGHMPGTVESTVALGLIEEYVGHWDLAADRYAEALQLAEQMDPSPQAVLAQRHLGRLQLRAGDYSTGGTHLEKAHALVETMPETLEYAPTLLALAELRTFENRLDEALRLARQSFACVRPVEQLAETHAVLSHLCSSSGDHRGARAHAAEALLLAKRLDSPRLLSRAYLASAEAARDRTAATAAFEAALEHAVEARAPYERSLVLRAYAEHFGRQAVHLDRAAIMASEANAVVRNLALTPVGLDSTLVV